MRYRLAALMLFAVLPLMNALAAPAPEPYAILDIGLPWKGDTAEQYRKRQIEGQTFHGTLSLWSSDPEVQKLSIIAPMKDPRPWLAKNLRVTEEADGRRLRFTFLGGTRAEKTVILNALLKVKLFWRERSIKFEEEGLRSHQACILELEQRIQKEKDRNEIDSYRKGIDDLRSNRIPACQAEIARMKQFAVIRWAK